MTKFTPRTIEENVNVSKISPKQEFFTLLSWILIVSVVVYFCLGITLDLMIDHMPEKFEKMVMRLNIKGFESCVAENDPNQLKVQTLLNDLAQLLSEKSYPHEYTVSIIDEEKPNALAFVGGNIIVTSGLLTEITSENELAMVLAHELGHYQNKDHLRVFGRGILFVILSSAVFGANSNVTEFAYSVVQMVETKYSRRQESSADIFALNLLNEKYGHVAGAADFFETMKENEKFLDRLFILSSHPVTQRRIENIQQTIEQNGYVLGEKIPLSFSLTN